MSNQHHPKADLKSTSDPNLNINIGKHEVIIAERYEAISTVNDLVIAVWFLIGSFMFLNDKLVTDGTWLFIVGSIQMLIKPLITLAKLIHVRKIRANKVK